MCFALVIIQYDTILKEESASFSPKILLWPICNINNYFVFKMPGVIDKNLIYTYAVYLTVFLLKMSKLLKINTLKVNFIQCPVISDLCLSL